MTAKDKLIKEGYIKEAFEYSKYNKYFDKIFDAVEDYGYFDKIIPEQKDNPNIGHKDTEEYMAFCVKKEKKEEFEDIMKDLNIYLPKENKSKNGIEKEFYTFKTRNNPELTTIVKGCVKIKEKEKSNAMLLSHNSMNR